MTVLTNDLREEGEVLYDFLKQQPKQLWKAKTLFKDWTVWDVVAHLHLSDHMAVTTAQSDEDFAALSSRLMGYFQKGLGLKAYAKDWLGDLDGGVLLEQWYDSFTQMCDIFDSYPPDARLKWFGPDMGIRMFSTARQMETWAHGQAVYDLVGVERKNSDRLKNIVVIGIKTFAFAFKNRGLPVPEERPFIELSAPSGAIWSFGEAQSANVIRGSAVEFAQVVTQTRNIADTALERTGDVSHQWMKIAQCFAGAPENPPAAGLRTSA